MSQSFFKMVVTLATIALVLQACGKGKLTVADPNVSRSLQQQRPAVATPTVSENTNDVLTPASKELDTALASDKLKISKTSATKTVDADKSIGINAVVNISGDKSEDIKISVKNPAPTSAPTAENHLSVVTGDIATTTIDYKISYKGYVDYQDPQSYYLIVTLTSKGQSAATQEFAIVVGEDDAVKTGVLILDNVGADSLDSKIDGFYKYLSTTAPTQPQVLTLTSDAFEPAQDLQFTLGADKLDIKATGTLSVGADNKLTASVDLMVNGEKTTITDSNQNAPIALTSTSLKYNLSVLGSAQQTSEYFMILTLQRSDSDLSKPENTRSFAVAFGTGNEQLKASTVLMLNNPLGSDMTNDSFMQMLKSKYPLAAATPTAPPPAAQALPGVPAPPVKVAEALAPAAPNPAPQAPAAAPAPTPAPVVTASVVFKPAAIPTGLTNTEIGKIEKIQDAQPVKKSSWQRIKGWVSNISKAIM